MNRYFTHLHVHTEYSLLDGALSIEQLVDFGKTHQLPAIGISDHGNIFGAVKFFRACKKANIKPVLGSEVYFIDDVTNKSNDNRYYHLLLIVENQHGYRNLCKLMHLAHTKGFYFKPRIDYAMLTEYSEGLIATTACIGGHIPSLILEKKETEARHYIERMRSIFGDQNFFFEVQPGQTTEQELVNKVIFSLSDELGIPTIATGDCHYATIDDQYAHEVMLSVQTKHKMSDPDRMTFGDYRAHLRTPAEMAAAFPDREDILYRTGEIADRCTFSFDTGKRFFPLFEIPQNITEYDYFKQLCTSGLQKLFDSGRIVTNDEEPYWNRLNDEIDLIAKMGFITYFLVVSDFIHWAAKEDIPHTARGSAAGSLAAMSLDITTVDPLRYHLFFERFLNPERVTMPDIDIDFCIEGRERVIEYVRNRYGHDKVCQIITFGTMMAKGVVKDVSRALGLPFDDANAITNLIPDQLKITLKEAFEQEPRLGQMRDANPKVAEMFSVAFKLEGLTRHASKHAAGVVITPEPIDEMLPVYVPPKTNDLVTQYDMNDLESLGFLKMDFLGLKNLTLIKRVTTLIKKIHQTEVQVELLPLDDSKTFELVCCGDTAGVFQLESSGMKEILRRLKPESIEDIIAVTALYRPGPLGSGMVEDFIERRHGRQKIHYLFPELEPVLKETYGVIVYQEQVMKTASVIAGYSLGEADILRRAMGKKKVEVMAEQRTIFVKRAIERGFNETKSGELFDLLAYFAGYGFNKSHSTAYGMIAYQTAYLKAHYPSEFMACLISLENHDPEKMAFYVQEAREMGIAVLPPDINQSDAQFTVENNNIRFGLVGVKNAGESGLDSCLEERAAHGAFTDLLNFCKRVDLRTCNKRFIESLIAAGAFDALPGNRAQKSGELAHVMERAIELKEAAATGQMGLFGSSGTKKDTNEGYAFEPVAEWNDREKLEREKEVLGLYLSARPLDAFKRHISWLNIKTFAQAKEIKSPVLCCGSLKNSKVITTKKGDRMAFTELEDESGTAEIIIFPKLYQQVALLLESTSLFVVKGVAEPTEHGICKIKAENIYALETIFNDDSIVDEFIFSVPSEKEDLLHHLHNRFIAGNATLSFIFSANGKKLKLHAKNKCSIDLETLKTLHEGGIAIRVNLQT
ncbi:MAG: DNA polymerase III subunit alpha [Candidatus Babeliaceae bacterium]|nr:DNA polymerase III subunit alpha [Candidatus Babeliaceae bacterium]